MSNLSDIQNRKDPVPWFTEPLPIPSQKWKDIGMDFIEGLPTSQGKNVILVVVDCLTKYAHFLPLSHPYNVQKIDDLIMDNIVKLHGPPISALLITLNQMAKLNGSINAWSNISGV
jgi:hypothetical protein